MNLFIWFLVLCLGLLAEGCSWGRTSPSSMVLIVVDGLGWGDLDCEDIDNVARETSGFAALCDESIRFTHAYSPSSMSQPVLASLFTGLYPIEHGVRHNGAESLSAKFKTLAEVAVERGYRTGFWSGGPPIFAKSGLGQGFEIFYDRLYQLNDLLAGAANSVLQDLWTWIESLPSGESFLAGAFLVELTAPTPITGAATPDVRERGRVGQLRRIDLALAELIRHLKKSQRWDQTHIVLVGTHNSAVPARTTQWPPMNLKGERLQITMMIKPQRPKRDSGLNWSVDPNVSVVDLGHTLFELMGGVSAAPIDGYLVRVSLASALDSPRVEWDEDRLILAESAWANWRGIGTIRYSARYRQYLYIHDTKPKLFNTLIDRMEVVELPEKDPMWLSLNESVLDFFQSRDLVRFKSPDDTELEKRWQRAEIWEGPETELQRSRFLTRIQQGKAPGFELDWAVKIFAEAGDWDAIFQLGKIYNNPNLIFLARKATGQPEKRPSDPCLILFKRPYRLSATESAALAGCYDESASMMKGVLSGADEEVRQGQIEELARWMSMRALEDRWAIENQRRFTVWDIPQEWPRGLAMVDWWISQPGSQRMKDQLKRRTLDQHEGLDL